MPAFRLCCSALAAPVCTRPKSKSLSRRPVCRDALVELVEGSVWRDNRSALGSLALHTSKAKRTRRVMLVGGLSGLTTRSVVR
jgi:hypothetical protein